MAARARSITVSNGFVLFVVFIIIIGPHFIVISWFYCVAFGGERQDAA